ncbi:hypothetical protein [Methylobacterium amylolyticum]|uniref:hypothetical protein n=1 Tax=Methylobacterium sp. NEAU 140 TaxID=3064945 RepID=UPI0027327CF9|nr:hypothetical protein [Methylobacterium sp. NEAU 140]
MSFSAATAHPDLRDWRARIEGLDPGASPCPGLFGEAWQRKHAALLSFLERLGAEAVDLGWSELDLFGIHPTAGVIRVDHCDALVLGRHEAEWVDATRMGFRNLTDHRDTPGRPRGIPIRAFGG